MVMYDGLSFFSVGIVTSGVTGGVGTWYQRRACRLSSEWRICQRSSATLTSTPFFPP